MPIPRRRSLTIEAMTSTDYALALAAALRRENLSHALFNVLTATAKAQSVRGFTTIPQLFLVLAVSFQNVWQHLFKSSHFFEVDKMHQPARITLSKEGIALLAAVQRHVAAEGAIQAQAFAACAPAVSE